MLEAELMDFAGTILGFRTIAVSRKCGDDTYSRGDGRQEHVGTNFERGRSAAGRLPSEGSARHCSPRHCDDPRARAPKTLVQGAA